MKSPRRTASNSERNSRQNNSLINIPVGQTKFSRRLEKPIDATFSRSNLVSNPIKRDASRFHDRPARFPNYTHNR